MEATEATTQVDRTTSALLRRSPSNPFTPLHTALYAIAWGLVMMQGWGDYIGTNPTSRLYYPAETAARVVNRDMQLATSLEGAGALSIVGIAIEEPVEVVLAQSIWNEFDALDVVTERFEAGTETAEPVDRTNVQLAILLVEAGRVDEAFLRIEEIRDVELRAAVTNIYGEGDRDRLLDTQDDEARVVQLAAEANQRKLESLVLLAAAGIEEWMLERAAIRTLGNHDEESVNEALAEIVDAPNSLRRDRHLALTLANLFFVALGVLLLIPLAYRAFSPEANEAFAAPWSASLGWAVMVRADFWNRLYFVTLGQFGDLFEDPAWLAPFYTWGTVIVSLPMLWLVYRHLLRASPVGLFATFGMRFSDFATMRALKITGGTVSIDLMGVTAIASGLSWLGIAGVWSEGVDETLIWGTTGEVITSCIEYLAWTPAFEEMMFRGLLFFTLRRQMNAMNAAAASSLLFGALHFYSLAGFLMTFWSGFIWALAFERARSLLPSIAAHSVYNLMFVLGLLIVYR